MTARQTPPETKTEFFLIRHGPTHAKTMVGWSDLPADLSDTAALARLEAALPREALLVSSDLSRAVATADALQAGRRRLPHDPALREMNFGAWELRSWKEVDAESPEHIRAFWDQPGDIAPPDGESWNALCKRVNGAMDTLARAHPGKFIIVVGHFGQILCQIQRAGAMTALEAFGQKIDNLSLSRVTCRQAPSGALDWSMGPMNANANITP